jgi:hypothetical protein
MTPQEKREKRTARDRERRAAQQSAEAAWQARVDAHFGYLT